MLSPFRWLLRSKSVVSKPRRSKRPGLAFIENLENRTLLTNIFSEGFEGAFPGSSWTTASSQGRVWDDNLTRAHTGSWSGFSADSSNGTGQTSYLSNMNTTMSQTVDLSDFRNVTLSYWRFLNTEATFDTFQATVFKTGVGSVTSSLLSGSLQTWTQDTLQVPESLWGQSGVTVRFTFISDGSVVPGGTAGVWVDDILMDGFQDPGFPESTISVPSGTSLKLNQFGDISNVSGNIGSAGEVDTIGFGIDVSGSYTITVSGAVDAQLRVYNATGTAISGLLDSFLGGGTESFTFNATSGEARYFQVGGFTSSTGSYSVSVTGPSSSPTTKVVASPTYSVSDSGSIGFAGDRDYYSFTAPAETTTLSINVSPSANLDSYITLLDTSGAVLVVDDTGATGGADNLTNFSITPGTTYVLMVSGFGIVEGSGGSESYSFTIDFDPDNSGQPPSTITVPSGTNLRLNQFGDISGVGGSIGSTLEFDTFGFGVETTGSYAISISGALDTQLRVYDSAGNAVTGIIDSAGGNGTETTNVNLTAGQTCYFVVGGFGTLTGNYSVSVSGPTATVPASTFASPNYFVAGSDSINNAGDRDYFGVTAPATTNSLTIILNPSAGLDGFISLFDAAGVFLQSADNFGNGGAETIASFAVTAGTSYVVMFSGFALLEGSGGAESYYYSLDFNPDLVDNNVAPTIPAGQSLPLAENSAAGTVVGTVVANDANSTAPNNTLTYQILGGSPSNPFSINPATGQITFNGGALNFESTPQFTLQVKVTDGGAGNLNATQNVVIGVTDVNEAPSIPAGQTFQILENSAANTNVGTVSASDPDSAAPNNTLNYSIVSGNPSNPFSINTATGQITVANPAALNFEVTPQFTLQVKVTDEGVGNLNSTQTVVINLIDANDPPTIPAGQSFTVAENSANGTTLGNVQASDPDTTAPNNTKNFSITNGNTNNAFTINPSTGAIAVSNAAVLDFETTQSFGLTVTVTDGNGQSASQGVAVNLTNVNEPPTVTPGQDFSVDENSPLGTSLGEVAANDPDTNKVLTYSITGGNTGNAFAVNASTGGITVNTVAAVNFETTPVFNLTVTATDGGSLSDSKVVVVHLNNVNEAPILGAPGSSPTFVFKSRTPVNILPSITVTDPDGATDLATVSINVSIPAGKKKFDVYGGNGPGSLGSVSGSFLNGNMTINLSNGVTTAQVQAFLQSITFSTKGASLKTLTRNVSVTVTDKNGLTSTVSQTINVRKK